MRLAVLLPDLRPGGAERMRVRMAKYWAEQGHHVEFLLCRREGELLGWIPESNVFNLHAPRIRGALWPLVNYLREKRPDALLAGMWPLTVLAPLAAKLSGYKGRVVISEHAPQSLTYASKGFLHAALMTASMRLLYPMADARVAVSLGVAEDMSRLANLPRDAVSVIHNPAATGREVTRGVSFPAGALDGPLILAVGALKSVKRHDLLISAFARLSFRGARLYVLGEGSERRRLERLIDKLELRSRVFLPGYVPDPTPWYAQADLFVLSSDHEGFGNVIVEALEQGLPVVSTDCPHGPREILADGAYGMLVPVGDVDAMANAIEQALTIPHDREALRCRAMRFSLSYAADAYLHLLSPGDLCQASL